MLLIPQSPKFALRALLKQKPLRCEMDIFKNNLVVLLDKINIIENQSFDETEEHLKNNIRDFLRDTYYKDTNAINTKDKKDLVIHLDKTTNSDVGIIIEAKRPTNVSEMITTENINKKAFYELILYYLNERNQSNNNQLKHLIITNVYEWFIFDANSFDKLIFRNNQISKLYETKQNDKKDNPWFYEELAKIIKNSDTVISFIFIDIRDYETFLRNQSLEDDKKLIALFKIFSPNFLLKIYTNNDSNSLNTAFYKELLYILGLEDVKEGSKNIIRRKIENRHTASIIELTIDVLKTEDTLHRVTDIKSHGENKEEQIFNIALELCITWINRILFLKLLEGQLVTYHKKNKEFRFLNTETIHDFDELFKLFHKVLAVNIPDRTEIIQQKYHRIPYLNSSLFEISELEDQTIKINSLENKVELEILNTTVLKETKKKANKLPILEYLFNFLDAYDFASEGNEEIQEENKTIINASVLGKVFEKINGYKDGSIFTPAFITMYMCRQSIRLATIQKFNEVKQWNIHTFEELYNQIEDKKEANQIINSIKICDPAVGSGHFLVSALNEIIAIKSELNILMDENGKTLRDYTIEIVDDELYILDENNNQFIYQYKNKECLRVQKTLFHEKQTIIENCLFGVDINPKSVLICRLRLWIELLKNAYYKEPDFIDLETLPNIDINIKCGNSLLNRFPLNADLTKVLKSIKYDIKAYRGFVNDYKNEKKREVKRGLQKIINSIKTDFRTEIFRNDPIVKKLNKLQFEYNLLVAPNIFNDNTVKEDEATYGNQENIKKADERKLKLQEEINAIHKEIDEIKNNRIYRNAFEWRFEFPEVLNNTGEFEGFDLIIGNPPYIKEYDNREAFNGLRNLDCYQGKMDLWYLFGELGLKLIKPNNYLCLIATNNWVTNAGASKFRNEIINHSKIIELTDFGSFMIFENASIQTMVMLFKKDSETDNYSFNFCKLTANKPVINDVTTLLKHKKADTNEFLTPHINRHNFIDKSLTFNNNESSELLNKIKSKQNFVIDSKKEIAQGIVPNPDIVNSNNFLKLSKSIITKNNIKIGDGVFVVEKGFFKKLSIKEKKYIKPIYEPYLIDKYIIKNNDKEIIYITKKNYKNDAPNLIEHLSIYKEIMDERRENQQFKLDFFHLHWPRDEYFFEKGAKILSVRKCASPTFSYTEEEAYVMMSFNVIKTDRINLKYLTGLLNSKLVAFWLRKKGKMQGNAFQIDKEPLLEIPILRPSDAKAHEIAKLVDKIIDLKQQNKESISIESKIDELIFNLYELTPAEINIIKEI